MADLILNSPFLAWNLDSLNKFTPLVSALGAIFPGWKHVRPLSPRTGVKSHLPYRIDIAGMD